MNELFAIGIPTLNCADLLNEALEKYVVDFPNTMIVIVDNGNQQILKHDNIIIQKMPRNMGFTSSCNRLLDPIFKVFKLPYAFILNDDIYWGKKEAEVTDFIKEKENIGFSLIASTMGWCNFLLPEKTFKEIGDWDVTNFFNYFSDNDYSRRVQLAGRGFTPSTFLNPVVYRESQTIKRDPSINLTSFDQSKRNYIAKWGGMPGSERYKYPYNKQP